MVQLRHGGRPQGTPDEARDRPGEANSSLVSNNVIPLRPHTDMKVEPSIIAIPGYYVPPVQDWNMRSELTQAAISVDSVSHLHTYLYQPNQELPDTFSWDAFLKTGSDLAEDIARLATKYPRRPIIFIAHSLGGVLLKKALLLAHQNLQDPRFKLVVDCLSGILFLGTPHAGISDEDTFLRHNQVLYECAKTSVQKHTMRLSRQDIFQLSHLAATFEQIASVPILSVFEYADRVSGMQKLFGRRNKALVDQQLATISSSAEHVLGVHLNHKELCELSMLKDQTYSARDFLRRLFEDLADNHRWVVGLEEPAIPNRTIADPLNPLNLAPIGVSEHKIDSSQTPPAILPKEIREPNALPHKGPVLGPKLPLLLNVIADSGSDRLLRTRDCRLPCFTLTQQPNPNFTGRDDILSAMDTYLLPRNLESHDFIQSTRLYALCGMGGIGKTDIAIEYAYSRRSKFGAVLWLDAGGVAQLASDFGRLASQLGLEQPDEAKDLESSIQLTKAWLTRPREPAREENESWLLIFDNADNLDVITDYIPYNGNGSILVTSRDPFAKEQFFCNASGIDLRPLPTQESASLLRKLITRQEQAHNADEEEASVNLAYKLDGLPLAMIQMAGYIRRRHLSIPEFVRMYNGDAAYAQIHNVGMPILEHRYGHTLATAYNFQDLKPHATKLLQLLAFMSPDRVLEDIFVSSKSVQGETQSYWTLSNFSQARYELLSSSIVKRNTQKREMWIHRVVQAEVRARMDDIQRYETFREAVSLLAKFWPPGELTTQANNRWTLCEDLMPHLEVFYNLYIEYTAVWGQYDVDPAFLIVLNEAGIYLHERGLSNEAKSYLTLATTLCKQANVTTEPLVSNMHLTMGAVLNGTKDPQQCLEHNAICLEIRRAVARQNGKPDLRLAFAHNQMGIAYMGLGKHALATEYFKQSVELLDSIKVDPDDYGYPICNLGLAYWVQGQVEKADKLLTDLLAQRELLYGKLDTFSSKTGRVLHALGNARAGRAAKLEADGCLEAAQKLWDESFAIHLDCLKQFESTLGKSNHRVADACHKLAEHHMRRKEYNAAENYLNRALSIWGGRYWFRHETARSSFLRGINMQMLGGEENMLMGKRWMEQAKQLRAELLPSPSKVEVDTADFDALVCFWSR